MGSQSKSVCLSSLSRTRVWLHPMVLTRVRQPSNPGRKVLIIAGARAGPGGALPPHLRDMDVHEQVPQRGSVLRVVQHPLRVGLLLLPVRLRQLQLRDGCPRECLVRSKLETLSHIEPKVTTVLVQSTQATPQRSPKLGHGERGERPTPQAARGQARPLQPLQDPILLLSWVCFRVAAFRTQQTLKWRATTTTTTAHRHPQAARGRGTRLGSQ